jgi:hypothetical protein
LMRTPVQPLPAQHRCNRLGRCDEDIGVCHGGRDVRGHRGNVDQLRAASTNLRVRAASRPLMRWNGRHWGQCKQVRRAYAGARRSRAVSRRVGRQVRGDCRYRRRPQPE